MADTAQLRPPPAGPREPFNFWTHFAGALFMLCGTLYLGLTSFGTRLFLPLVAYGLCVTFVFGSSALYHYVQGSVERLRRLDHFAIGMGIWGTYLAICEGREDLIGHRVIVAETICLLILGVVLLRGEMKTGFRVILFAVMGWMAVVDLPGMVGLLGLPVTVLVLVGGLIYTVGMVIYAVKKPDPWPEKMGFHGLWHLFVIGGAACHFVAAMLIAKLMR